jgi:hypothetical protein
MNSFFIWDIMPCRPVKVTRRFGGIYRLHLQGRIVGQAEEMKQALLVVCFIMLGLLFDPEDGGDVSLRNVG